MGTLKRNPTINLTPAPGEWLNLPESLLAPSPHDPNVTCRLGLTQIDVRKAARAGRRQPIFELWSVVLGVAPPVPGVHHRNPSASEGLIGLQHAHACFQGIKRPLAEDDDGDNVVAYVSRPRFLYEYDPNMVSVAVKRPTPRDVVFVAYARLAKAGVSPIGGTLGTITHWGFVETDRSERSLPIHYSSRYRTRLW